MTFSTKDSNLSVVRAIAPNPDSNPTNSTHSFRLEWYLGLISPSKWKNEMVFDDVNSRKYASLHAIRRNSVENVVISWHRSKPIF